MQELNESYEKLQTLVDNMRKAADELQEVIDRKADKERIDGFLKLKKEMELWNEKFDGDFVEELKR
jgi:hypothetical protein